MTNPYQVLGVPESASDEEVKRVYRELAKKYHPDNYGDSPLKEVAEEKMAEVNDAYNSVMDQRKARAGNTKQNANPYGNAYNNQSYGNTQQGNSSFQDIRVMIQQNRLVEAEELLDGVPVNSRDGEWYFLKGSVYYSRGWLEDAANHFSSACRLNPNNPEYRAAMNRMMWQKQGNFGAGNGNNPNPYRTQGQGNAGGCNSCDCCSSLICADCCCECAGGDLIACC